ncbi:HNH endonuclease family protein (plasmid) [Mycolicibacterium fortuitum]|uniref:HNH endonuclease family protein n=1 Tax=Mycolicibacterium conceptionense TaxID=451644 RepID=UPI003204D074|nr:HNH endonuclease family protein [Mycolicibacterium fortuitum]
MKRRHLIVAASLVAAVIGGLTNLADSGHADPVVAESSPQTSASIATLLGRVAVVDGIRKQPGYQRGCKKGQRCVFGPAWNDPSNSTGCDTRNRILRNQLVNVEFKPGTRGCKVASGLLHDPYSGTDIAFSSRDDADAVQIDHVAPLSAVWDLGAWAWPLRQRQLFANDTDNLLAVSGSLNGGKSDATISEWLPPNRKFVCRYIEIYLSVMAKYQLPITRADRDTASRHCLFAG